MHCTPAHAQPGAAGAGGAPKSPQAKTQAAREALQQALAQARGAGRVLLVTHSNNASNAKSNARIMTIPATAAWVARRGQWHDVTDMGLIGTLVQGGVKPAAGADPMAFRDGKSLGLLGCAESERKPSAQSAEGSIVLALRLDWAVRSPVQANAPFVQANDQAAAATTLPAIATLHDTAEQGVEAFKPTDAQRADPLGVLNQARALVKAGKPEASIGMYTWLWERGAQGAPAFDCARIEVVAREMGALALASPKAMERFKALRAREAGALDVRDLPGVHTYLILCRVVGDFAHNIGFIDGAVSEPIKSRLIPEADAEAFRTMLPLCHYDNPLLRMGPPARRPLVMLERAGAIEKGKSAQELGALAAYLRWLAPREAARRYAWLLGSKPEQAEAFLTELQPVLDADWKAMLAAAARAAGHEPSALVTGP